ncbi:hypothetical protein ACPPVU_24700 [Mucilaginibacter sp. McL0603]|uniref:hypothetical protein n=1 Tax=Mucilaginibacter sp. McL0603 TaxID=3415670 RepID=UPI003CE9A7AD
MDGRLILNLSDNDKSYYLRNGTKLYYEQLRVAYKDILGGAERPYTYFAFVTLCSATLEASLNFIILNFCLNKYGPLKLREYYESYIGLRFKSKLHIIPSLLSEGKLIINEDNPSVKQLEMLITLRNRLLHNKETLETFDLPHLGSEIIDGNLVIPVSNANIEFQILVKDNPIESIDRDMCLKFGEALGCFKKLIMDAALTDTFIANEMLMLCSW